MAPPTHLFERRVGHAVAVDAELVSLRLEAGEQFAELCGPLRVGGGEQEAHLGTQVLLQLSTWHVAPQGREEGGAAATTFRGEHTVRWHRRAARRAGPLQRPLEENTRSGGTAGPRGGRGRCNDLQRRTHGQVAPQGREEGGAAATTFRGEHKVRWHRRAARRAGPLQRPSEENTKASTLT